MTRFARTLSFLAAVSVVTCFVAVTLANGFPPCASACASTSDKLKCYACCEHDTTCNANQITLCMDACDSLFGA